VAPLERVERAGFLAAHAILEEHGLTPAGARNLGSSCAKFANGTLSEEVRPLKSACEPGCAWCCLLGIPAWPAEVIHLAAFLESQRNKGEVASLRERLREAVSQAELDRSSGRARVACPLLTPERRCSAYEARPASCAATFSFDAARCQAYAEAAEPEQKIGVNAALLVPAEVAAHVLMRRGGPDTEVAGAGLDLHSGLTIALERGSKATAAAWMAGEDVFRVARESFVRRRERLKAEQAGRAVPKPPGLVTLGRAPKN
jgi:Fe-S-cluster containining protein